MLHEHILLPVHFKFLRNQFFCMYMYIHTQIFSSLSCSHCNTNCPSELGFEMNQIKSFYSLHMKAASITQEPWALMQTRLWFKTKLKFSFTQEKISKIYIIRLFLKLQGKKSQLVVKGIGILSSSAWENNPWLHYNIKVVWKHLFLSVCIMWSCSTFHFGCTNWYANKTHT